MPLRTLVDIPTWQDRASSAEARKWLLLHPHGALSPSLQGGPYVPPLGFQSSCLSRSHVRLTTLQGRIASTLLFMEDVAAKFEAAWEVFARTCAGAVAPEATFQAWFAHYLISQFGIDRVAREPIFNHRHADSKWQALVPGGEVKLDAVVLRQPGVNLPHYVHRQADADGDRDRTGMATLADLAVISELKVAATAGKGLHHRQVAQDVYKLSMLLEQAEKRGIPLPMAYLGILNNNLGHSYNRAGLDKRLEAIPHHPDVRILISPEPSADQ
jgi:hypothetical protein